MKFVFLMDPLETVKVSKDTTFILMVGASRAGHDVYYLPKDGLSLQDGIVKLRVMSVRPRPGDAGQAFDQMGWEELSGDEIDALFIRPDPPFDDQYLYLTWILDRLPSRVFVMNHPGGVRSANEKLWATQFTDLIPNTLVSSNRDHYLAFLEQEEAVVVKPLNGFGGMSVFKVTRGDANAQVVFETLTRNGHEAVIVQSFMPDAAHGDKRIILLDGAFLGAVLRVQDGQDHRNNFFSGGRPEPIALDEADQMIIDTIRPHLKAMGLHFVGIDVIGGKLIEVNVTSPTCLQEINRLGGGQLEDRVIIFVEDKVRQQT